MCFLFSDDEFSATALLSESTRIKNTYTDGIILCACKNKIHTSKPISISSCINFRQCVFESRLPNHIIYNLRRLGSVRGALRTECAVRVTADYTL